MIDLLIDSLFMVSDFFSSAVLLMRGTGAKQIGKSAGINHILFLYPFSSSSADGWLRADILYPCNSSGTDPKAAVKGNQLYAADHLHAQLMQHRFMQLPSQILNTFLIIYVKEVYCN